MYSNCRGGSTEISRVVTKVILRTVYKPLEEVINNLYPILAIQKMTAAWDRVRSLIDKKLLTNKVFAYESILTFGDADSSIAAELFKGKLEVIWKMFENQKQKRLSHSLYKIHSFSRTQPNKSLQIKKPDPSSSTKAAISREQAALQQSRLERLRDELKVLLDQEDAINGRLETIHQDFRHLEEQEHHSPKYSMDKTLEIMILEKEISRVSGENKQLKKEIVEAGQDTTMLLKQVNDLLQASENRGRSRRLPQDSQFKSRLNNHELE
jgi:hypothetical protein